MSDGAVPEVSTKAAESLGHKMRKRAQAKCKDLFEIYANCTRPRTISIVWACREELAQANECTKRYNNDETLNEYKRRWAAAGYPTKGFEPDMD